MSKEQSEDYADNYNNEDKLEELATHCFDCKWRDSLDMIFSGSCMNPMIIGCSNFIHKGDESE